MADVRKPYNLTYNVQSGSGWNSVMAVPTDDPKWSTRIHYVKTTKLAQEMAVALNDAFARGVQLGRHQVIAEVALYESTDFEGWDPAQVMAEELRKKDWT